MLVCTHTHTHTHTHHTSQPNFSELWKLIKGLQKSRELLFTKTQFRLSMNAKLRDALMCPILILSLPISWEALKTNSWQSNWGAAWQPVGADQGWSSLKAPFTEHCYPLAHMMVLWKALLARLSLFVLTWSSLGVKSLFSGIICQKWSETINCLILQLPGLLW